MKKTPIALALAALSMLSACNDTQQITSTPATTTNTVELLPQFTKRLDIYQEMTLTTDLSH